MQGRPGVAPDIVVQGAAGGVAVAPGQEEPQLPHWPVMCPPKILTAVAHQGWLNPPAVVQEV